MKEKLVSAVKQLKSGDPRQEDTFIGPLISQKEAERVEAWVSDALARGDPGLEIIPHMYTLQTWSLEGSLTGTSSFWVAGEASAAEQMRMALSAAPTPSAALYSEGQPSLGLCWPDAA